MTFEEHVALPDGFAEMAQDCARRLDKLKRQLPEPACYELNSIAQKLWAMSEFPHPIGE